MKKVPVKLNFKIGPLSIRKRNIKIKKKLIYENVIMINLYDSERFSYGP